MTITISEQAYDELFRQETVERSQHPDPDDSLDVMYKYPHHFHFSGGYEDRCASIGSGEYGLFGVGLDPNRTCDCSDRQPLPGSDRTDETPTALLLRQ